MKEAKTAGLNPADPPTNAAQFLHWVQALTIRKNGKIVQSGLGSDLASVATTYWGIVAAQYGFQRVSSDGKKACVNPAGAASAMNWLVSLFDKYKVINPTTTLYQSFDTGQSAMMMEGPWTIFGNNQAGLDWEAAPLPVIRYPTGELFRRRRPGDLRVRRARRATSPRWKRSSGSLITAGSG